jgi:hypothetical protein
MVNMFNKPLKISPLCSTCPAFVEISPHIIIDGQVVKGCDIGEAPEVHGGKEYCYHKEGQVEQTRTQRHI